MLRVLWGLACTDFPIVIVLNNKQQNYCSTNLFKLFIFFLFFQNSLFFKVFCFIYSLSHHKAEDREVFCIYSIFEK